jgi:hypothetical protein
MTSRPLSAVARCLAALRRWLSGSWVGRVALGWRDWLFPREAGRKTWPLAPCRPELCRLEGRDTPQDMFGAVAAALGGLMTPSAALFDAWLSAPRHGAV